MSQDTQACQDRLLEQSHACIRWLKSVNAAPKIQIFETKLKITKAQINGQYEDENISLIWFPKNVQQDFKQEKKLNW